MAVELLRQIGNTETITMDITKNEPFKIGGFVIRSDEVNSTKNVNMKIYLNGTDLSIDETLATFKSSYRSVHGIGEDFVFPADAKVTLVVVQKPNMNGNMILEVIVRTAEHL